MSWAQRLVPYVVVVIGVGGLNYREQQLADRQSKQLQAEIVARAAANCAAIRTENEAIISLLPPTADYYRRVADALNHATEVVCRKPKL